MARGRIKLLRQGSTPAWQVIGTCGEINIQRPGANVHTATWAHFLRIDKPWQTYERVQQALVSIPSNSSMIA
jgi:hypothetical protein